MMKKNKILAVSFIAMLAVSSAHATIVTQENIVGANGVSVTVPTSGTNKGKVQVSGPTVNNATLTIKKNGTSVGTFTANASAAKTIDITMAKGDVGLGNVDNTSDADKPVSTATQTALDAKQDTLVPGTNIEGAGSVTVTKDATSGKITVTGAATDISGKEDKSNKVTVTSGTGYDKTSTTLYPSMKTANQIATDAINALDVSTATNGGTANNVVTAVTETNGKISVTKGDAINAVAATASSGTGNVITGISLNADGHTLDFQKGITALTSHQDISGKENTSNKVTVTSGTGYDKTSTTKYPSMKTANQIATDAASGKQDKSTADYQMGKSGGGWTTMTSGQQNALNSGITSGKVSTYDGYATGKQDKLDATASTGNIKGASGITVTTPTTGDDAGKVVITGPTLATVATSGSYNDLSNKPTIPTVNNKTLTIKQGGANAQTFTANSASDVTVDITAAKVGADAAGAAATAKSDIETKLAAGANGYDINAKSLKVNGTAVLTSHQDISGKIDKTIANDKNGLIVRNASGVAAKGTGTDISVSGTTVTVNHATAANSATTATKATQDGDGNTITSTYATKSELTTGLAAKEDNTNKLTSDVSRNSTNLQSDTLYPTVATTQAMITDVTGALQTAVGNKQNKSTENYQMGNSSGGWTTMTTQQQNMLNGKIPVGSETATTNTTYASIWVE